MDHSFKVHPLSVLTRC